MPHCNQAAEAGGDSAGPKEEKTGGNTQVIPPDEFPRKFSAISATGYG